MENNVLSGNVALEKGHEPRLYPYTAEHVPVGSYQAVLDFKIWAKKAMGICCYFTQRNTGIKLLMGILHHFYLFFHFHSDIEQGLQQDHLYAIVLLCV